MVLVNHTNKMPEDYTFTTRECGSATAVNKTLQTEAADGKAEDVANQLAAYQQDQVAFYGNYAEFAQAQDNVENAVIAFKDNTVVMVIASNECTADLDSAVDNALA